LQEMKLPEGVRRMQIACTAVDKYTVASFDMRNTGNNSRNQCAGPQKLRETSHITAM